ncbi:MAG: BamA/TamA family outer membrane protein [Methylococcaceae bacterium]|nr:BamA/TamA family outer membrane protein [Methylococcaceae bacterium]
MRLDTLRIGPALRWLCGLILFCFSETAYPVEINYEGLNESTVATLQKEPALLDLAREEDPASSGFRKKLELATQAAEKVLRYYGFYNALITTEVTGETVEIRVEQGKPLTIGEIHLDAATPEGLTRLHEQFTLKPGQAFKHPDYELAKTQVLQSFLRDGYLKARFQQSRVKILPDRHVAEIRLELSEGPRYRFGPLVIEGMSDYPDDFYRQWQAFDTGEYFSQIKLLKFYQAVQGSGLFESVSIDASPDKAEANRVPVILSVKPYPPYSLTAALGYATDFGPRLRLDLKRYNVFGAGHTFRSDIVADTRQQYLKASYAIPVTERANRAYNVFSTLENRFLPDDEENLFNFGFGYDASFGRNGQYNSGAAYNFEKFTDQTQNRTTGKYFNVKSHRNWLFLDDNIDPSAGFSLDLAGQGIAEPLLSDFSALRLEGNAAAYEAFLDQLIRLRSRLQLGYLFASEKPINLPNSLRFFAGGVRSVRGYRYQHLAPINPLNGEIVGGKAILTTSMEAEIKIHDRFGWVAYSDFGGATDDFSAKGFGLSLGTGLRWHSPVGPMDLSVAFPLRNTTETFRLIVTVGSF